jgi:hypothetical protein
MSLFLRLTMKPIVGKVGPRLDAAITKAAAKAGVNRSEWIRRLIEKATGVADPPAKRGVAGWPAKKRKAFSAEGVKARRGR